MPKDFNLPGHCNPPGHSSQSRWLMLLIIVCLSLPIDYPPNRNRSGSSWLIGNLVAQDAGLKLPVTRDTWLSSVPQERGGANGGASRLKLKSYQEMSLVDFDTSSLAGRVIGKATLHVRSSSDAKFKRVTISSVSADWSEGDNTNYSASPGVSTFANRAHPDVPWSYPGSDFCSVILSQGYSRWASRDAGPPDNDGWQQIPVDPVVVAMHVAQLSYGFLVFDDTGTEWSRNGEKFTAQPFPNRYAFSREQGVRHAPYLVVELTDEDRMPPEAPTALHVSKADLPTDQWKLNWISPADRGPAGTLGFVMHIDDQPIQRYLVPNAGKPGQPVEMLLRDISLNTTRKHTLSIAAVDAAGNVGPALIEEISLTNPPLTAQLSTWQLALPAKSAGPLQPPVARLGQAAVAIVDELDKVHPVTGEMIPAHTGDYLNNNHLWNAKSGRISLNAAGGECVAFQIVLGTSAADIQPTLTLAPELRAAKVSYGSYGYVKTPTGPMADPILPLTFPLPSASKTEKQKFVSLHVEIQLPRGIPAGRYSGVLSLGSQKSTPSASQPGKELKLPVELRVWDFDLPDQLSFLAEMNCYGLPANERDYYRLAHAHRTVLNRLPYAHRGTIDDGCAPLWNGDQFDWTAWDQRFGPLLDGSVFQDLPRSGVPLDCFYLPLFENWPTPIGPHYNEGYWADQSLSAEYRRLFSLAAQRIAEHIRDRGWKDTRFHFYLNGKNDFKRNGWSRSTSPWILDEPSHFQDFWALRWFGDAFHEGVSRVPGSRSILFRADISRPQWQRDTLDGVVEYNVIGSAVRDYRRIVADRRERFHEQVIEYGTSNRPDQSNLQAVAWCIDAWTMGLDGVLPWQTIGSTKSWEQGDELSLFYPNQAPGGPPIPSVRLKAYRRGQQDVEYLVAAAKQLSTTRWQIADRIRALLRLHTDRALREGTGNAGGEDAGRIGYASLSSQELDALRRLVADSVKQRR